MKEPNLIEKAFLLKKTSIFSEINLDNLLLIADKVDSISATKGQVLFKEGHSPQYLYIILEGQIEINFSEGPETTTLGSGELFGDVALFKAAPYTHKAQAKTTVHLLALTKKHASSIFAECPSVALLLLESFAQKIKPKDLYSQKKESL